MLVFFSLLQSNGSLFISNILTRLLEFEGAACRFMGNLIFTIVFGGLMIVYGVILKTYIRRIAKRSDKS